MPDSARENVATAARSAKARGGILSVITGPDTLPPKQQIKRLLNVLTALKKETAAGVDDTFGNRIIKTITNMSRWLGKGRRDPAQSFLYRMIVDASRVFSNGIPDVSTRDRVVEYVHTCCCIYRSDS